MKAFFVVLALAGLAFSWDKPEHHYTKLTTYFTTTVCPITTTEYEV